MSVFQRWKNSPTSKHPKHSVNSGSMHTKNHKSKKWPHGWNFHTWNGRNHSKQASPRNSLTGKTHTCQQRIGRKPPIRLHHWRWRLGHSHSSRHANSHLTKCKKSKPASKWYRPRPHRHPFIFSCKPLCKGSCCFEVKKRNKILIFSPSHPCKHGQQRDNPTQKLGFPHLKSTHRQG